MQKSVFTKQNFFLHGGFILAFLLSVVIYFSPIFFNNKELSQNDIQQWRGGAEEIIKYKAETGKQTLWTNSMFGGMPSYFVSTEHYGNKMSYVEKVLSFNLPAPVGTLFLFLITFYILMLAFGASPVLAFMGAFAFAYSSFTLISLEAGHNGKVLAMSLMPLVLAGVVLAFKRKILLGTVVFAVGLAIQLRPNHLQITYYLAFIIIAYGILELVKAIKNKDLINFTKVAVSLVIGAALAIGTNAGSIMTTFEYGQYSIRGASELKSKTAEKAGTGLEKDYAFDWSYGREESFTALVPYYVGGSSSEALPKTSATYKAVMEHADEASANEFTQRLPLYFGDLKFTSGPIYFGAIIFFLFVLGVLILDTNLVVCFGILTVLSFLLAWGKNYPLFNYLIFDYFPGYNKFRAVSMALVIAQLTMPIVAVLALDKLFKAENKQVYYNKFLIALGFSAALLLIIWLMAGMRTVTSASDEYLKQYGDWLIKALHQDRISMVQSDALRSLFFILVAAGLVFAYMKNMLNAFIVSFIIAFFSFLDLWLVDKRYLNKENFVSKSEENFFVPTEADELILKDKTNYRVFNMGNPFNDARTSYFHKSVGGYSAAKLRRYQDLIESHLSAGNPEVFNMLNVKYIMTNQPERPVQTNPTALGNAWFVKTIKKVNSPDEELNALKDFKANETAVVDVSKFKIDKVSFDSASSKINLVDYKPDYLKYDVESDKDGFVVFSEIYYPEGWVCKIDGKETTHLRTNYVLRGMNIPAGKHVVEFSFDSKAFHLGNNIGLACSMILMISLIGLIGFEIKESKKELPEKKSI